MNKEVLRNKVKGVAASVGLNDSYDEEILEDIIDRTTRYFASYFPDSKWDITDISYFTTSNPKEIFGYRPPSLRYPSVNNPVTLIDVETICNDGGTSWDFGERYRLKLHNSSYRLETILDMK